MTTPLASLPEGSFEADIASDGTARITFSGWIGVKSAATLMRSLDNRLGDKRLGAINVDLSGVSFFDDYGTLVLLKLREIAEKQRAGFKLSNVPDHVRSILSITAFDNGGSCRTIRRKPQAGVFIRLGDAAIRQAYNVRFMISFLGSVVICFLHAARHPRSVRWNDIILYMQKTGVDAVPIVALISFLLGLIMAFVSSMQLQQFGAGIYVASLVALAMVSELGPIITAIIVAGRSGSAYAAEIGTMRISEEIDALYTMGFSPALFLTIPRLIAATIVVPMLTLFSDVFAILGGMAVSSAMLDLSVSTYISQTLKTLTLFELLWGMSKSVVFAVIVAMVGCLRGFQVRGGASEVGSAATSAVVTSIFLIIFFDSIFAVIRSYW